MRCYYKTKFYAFKRIETLYNRQSNAAKCVCEFKFILGSMVGKKKGHKMRRAVCRITD